MIDSTIHFDWGDQERNEDIDFTCPWCHGEVELDFETWLDDATWLKNEATGEWKRATNREHYGEDGEAAQAYEKDHACEHCTEGYLEPMMNYAYPVDVDLDDENKKKAAEHGLFLFENPDDNQVYMSLMGGGMDLSPHIMAAYLDLTGWIPSEWAMEFKHNYKANLTDEEHQRNAEACLKSLNIDLERTAEKVKAIAFYLRDPDEVNRLDAERMQRFDETLKAARDEKDPLLRGLIGFTALSKAVGDILPPDEAA